MVSPSEPVVTGNPRGDVARTRNILICHEFRVLIRMLIPLVNSHPPLGKKSLEIYKHKWKSHVNKDLEYAGRYDDVCLYPWEGNCKQKGQEFSVISQHTVSPRTAGLTGAQKQWKPKALHVQWLHVLLADEFLCNRACKYREKHGNASVSQTIPWQTAIARVCASWEERDGKLICLVSKVSLPWCLPTLNLSIKQQALGPGHRFWLLNEAAFYKGAREEDEASLRSLNSFVTKDVWNSDPAVWHCYWEPREKYSCLLPVCMCLRNISDH